MERTPLFRLQRAELYQNGLLTAHPDQLRLHDGTLIDLTNGKADATHADYHSLELRRAMRSHTKFSVPGVQMVHGKPLPNCRWPYAFSRTVPNSVITAPHCSPMLKRFIAFAGIGPNGELGEYSTPISVIPLERFEVRLVSPADDSVGVPLNPTFEWEHNGVGAHQVFFGYVSSVTAPASEYYVWLFRMRISHPHLTITMGLLFQDLKPGTYYRWDIFHAYAYTHVRKTVLSAIVCPRRALHRRNRRLHQRWFNQRRI